MDLPIYLDYAAATPADPRVIRAMTDCLGLEGTFGNPSARDHVYGWQAAEIVENARAAIAETVGCSPLDLTFTSGATESSNLAIIGLARGLKARGDQRRHIVTSCIEHHAVLSACKLLEQEGFRCTYLKPRPDGSTKAEDLAAVCTDDTFLVSIAQANSVIGTVNDIRSLSSWCAANNIYFHSDCAQSVGWEVQDFEHSEVALASLTPEKICGPKGVGALYAKKSLHLPLQPLIVGGGQERGLRGGTVAVHQVAGMGEAFTIMHQEAAAEKQRLMQLRAHLKQALAVLPDIWFNGDQEHCLPTIVSVTFAGTDGVSLLPSLPGIAASTGSACSSADLRPSYVLKAIGLSDQDARSSLRLSFGRFTTKEEISRAAAHIVEGVSSLRAAGNLWQVRRS